MNYLIKEFAQEAGFEIPVEPDGEFPYKPEFEKFAELIIEECANICEYLQEHPSTEPRHCAADIRLHFME